MALMMMVAMMFLGETMVEGLIHLTVQTHHNPSEADTGSLPRPPPLFKGGYLKNCGKW
jgi:hypothetical protein